MANSMFPISKESLESHAKELEMAMTSVRIGSERGDLVDLLKGLQIDNDWMQVDSALRNGFSLFYELYKQLQVRIASEKINGSISEAEKNTFMGAYSAFGAASYIRNKLNTTLKGEAMPIMSALEDFGFNFEQPRNDVLNQILGVYHNLTAFRKKQTVVKNGQDLVQSSTDFFKLIQDQALKLKPAINKKLVDLVATSEFRVMDEFTLSGFEAKLEEKAGITSKAEFSLTEPKDVAGNALAKKEMLRDMDRTALYDPILKKNPAYEVGGQSWSVIYVGLPGTGKSTLFLMGWTRLKRRCEQVTAFWKQKNFKELYFERISVDPKVKDKMYGGTAGKMAAADDETARADRINIGLIDDIDLLMEGDRDSGNGGADKDILNGLMQILGGVDLSKRKRGNTQWWAATNAPTKMDPALLQRFAARYEVDGPQKWYDFADILRTKLAGWLKPGVEIINVPVGDGYIPFEMRKNETGLEIATPQEQQYVEQTMKQFKNGIKTFADIGKLCEYFKQKNPRFTGRAIDAVTEAVKKRINDYDIPGSWFENPNEFFFKPFEERVKMLRDLSKPVSAEIMAQEVIRYARIEEAFAEEKFKRDVERRLYDARVNMEAEIQFKKQLGIK